MEQGRKTVRYDESLQMEAYRFAGIKQPFPAHFHDHYVVGLIEQGTRRMCCGNREYLLWPGDMLLLNPGDTHTCEQYGKAALLDYRMLNIPTPVMEDIARELGSPLPCFTQCVIQKSDLASQLRTLHQMILDGSNEFEKEELLFLLMEDLLTRYSRPFASCLPECREEVASVCAFLEEHYAQRITLDQLCRCANLSKSALLRAFTKYRGITPYRYLETLRINRAKALLEQGVSPVEAALQTGFSDQSHFTNYFRMFIGVAPGVYRDIFLKKRETTMDQKSEKCVMILDRTLPTGIIANTAAILGITLGKHLPEVVGSDVKDQSGKDHLGIIEFPVPILQGSPEDIRAIREALYQPGFEDLTAVDFSDLAQQCRTYDEFQRKMAQSSESQLQYLGLAICGPKKKINKLTGSIPLLR